VQSGFHALEILSVNDMQLRTPANFVCVFVESGSKIGFPDLEGLSIFCVLTLNGERGTLLLK
jgi:hypothetical protein